MARGWAWSCWAAWPPGAPSSARKASIWRAVASSLVGVATAPLEDAGLVEAVITGGADACGEEAWTGLAAVSAAKAALHRANHAAVIETSLRPMYAMRIPPL